MLPTPLVTRWRSAYLSAIGRAGALLGEARWLPGQHAMAAAGLLHLLMLSSYRADPHAGLNPLCRALGTRAHCEASGLLGTQFISLPGFDFEPEHVQAIAAAADILQRHALFALHGAARWGAPRRRPPALGVDDAGEPPVADVGALDARAIHQMFLDCVWSAIPPSYLRRELPARPCPMLEVARIRQCAPDFRANGCARDRAFLFDVFFPAAAAGIPHSRQQGWRHLTYFATYFAWLDARGREGREDVRRLFYQNEVCPHYNTRDKLIKYQRGSITMLEMPNA